MVADPLVMPLAREMLECLRVEIAKVASPPEFVGLRPGTVVDHLLSLNQDECCQGLAWVRPGVFFPASGRSGAFPIQDAVADRVGVTGWAVTLELGAIRCAPTPDARRIPTNTEWDTATQAVMDDAAAMRRAICCFIAGKSGRAQRVLPGIWQPVAVEGGCVGGVLPVTVQGPACDCSETGASS